MSEALLNVDWDLLHEQKLVLLELRSSAPDDSTAHQALSGISLYCHDHEEDILTAGRVRD